MSSGSNDFFFLLLLAFMYSRVGVQRDVPSLAPRKSEGFRESTSVLLDSTEPYVAPRSCSVVYIIEARTHLYAYTSFSRNSSGNVLRAARFSIRFN